MYYKSKFPNENGTIKVIKFNRIIPERQDGKSDNYDKFDFFMCKNGKTEFGWIYREDFESTYEPIPDNIHPCSVCRAYEYSCKSEYAAKHLINKPTDESEQKKRPHVRVSKDEYYLRIAKVVAIRSTCLRRQYGAVIVNKDEVISTGYNGAPRGENQCCDLGYCYKEKHPNPVDPDSALHGTKYGSCVAVHAEQNAILCASRQELNGATLYLACLDDDIKPIPCNVCDRTIKNAGIKEVISAVSR